MSCTGIRGNTILHKDVIGKEAYLPTTIRVNSKPFFTDFRWTWLGRFANPTYPGVSGLVNCPCCEWDKPSFNTNVLNEISTQTSTFVIWNTNTILIEGNWHFINFRGNWIWNVHMWFQSVKVLLKPNIYNCKKRPLKFYKNLTLSLSTWDIVSTTLLKKHQNMSTIS